MWELLDFSHWNPEPDWRQVQRDGIHGVYLALGDAAGEVDPDWHGRAIRARNTGLRVGGYWFARPRPGDAVREAGRMASLLGVVQDDDLAPLLDLEVPAVLAAGETAWQWVHSFNLALQHHTGVLAAFYSNPVNLARYRFPRPVGRALVLASYGPNDGAYHEAATPHPWRHVQAQQYTSRGRVAGVRGDVDRIRAHSPQSLLAHPFRGRL